MNISIDTWIALISAAVASAASIFSFGTWRVANRSLTLSEKNYKDKQPKLIPYVVIAKKTKHPTAGIVYEVELIVSNPTDSGNSIVRAELRIEYLSNQRLANFILQTYDRMPTENKQFTEQLRLPIRIEAHAAISARFTYAIDPKVLGKSDVRGYKVLIHDAHGEISTHEIILFTEVVDVHLQKKSRRHTTKKF